MIAGVAEINIVYFLVYNLTVRLAAKVVPN